MSKPTLIDTPIADAPLSRRELLQISCFTSSLEAHPEMDWPDLLAQTDAAVDTYIHHYHPKTSLHDL